MQISFIHTLNDIDFKSCTIIFSIGKAHHILWIIDSSSIQFLAADVLCLIHSIVQQFVLLDLIFDSDFEILLFDMCRNYYRYVYTDQGCSVFNYCTKCVCDRTKKKLLLYIA